MLPEWINTKFECLAYLKYCTLPSMKAMLNDCLNIFGEDSDKYKLLELQVQRMEDNCKYYTDSLIHPGLSILHVYSSEDLIHIEKLKQLVNAKLLSIACNVENTIELDISLMSCYMSLGLYLLEYVKFEQQ